MMRRVRLHELLVAAGGVTLGASGKIQIVHTEREMCPQDSIPTPDVADGLSSSTFEKAALAEKSEAPVMSPVSNSSSPTATASSATSSPQAVSSFAGQQGGKPVAKTVDKMDAAEATNASQEKKQLVGPLDIGHIDVYEIDTVRNGVGSTDPYIRPGDIVIVTEGEPIYLTGYFNAPHEIVMKDNMTLVRAVAMAGGLQKLAKSTIYIYRQVKGKVGPDKMLVDFNAIREGKKPDVQLQAYDIIDARPQSSFSPENLRQIFLGIGKGAIGNVGGTLPYRVLY
jgi:CTP:molybdopterin cytidylyltransferase MocA